MWYLVAKAKILASQHFANVYPYGAALMLIAHYDECFFYALHSQSVILRFDEAGDVLRVQSTAAPCWAPGL